MPDLSDRIAAARGDRPADIVLRGGHFLDLITGDLLDGDVAILGDRIVGTCATYDAPEIIDVTGLTLVPGFIDTHLHVESSLVTPYEFDRCVTPLGITTAICDPHAGSFRPACPRPIWRPRAQSLPPRILPPSCITLRASGLRNS